ncbi:hypothetical protein LZC95_11915 [Pendulispora brunnea]|uniref:Uncharacterized protein n=1 Tax=Pendulispora brunnea TaxID=2905690 RepID=A0ABZ2KMF3_9BACT
MNKRDEDEHQIDTVPPPPGEDDAYSAETRIGKIPSDLLQAMKRAHASEAGRPSLPPDLAAALGGDKGTASRPSVPASRTVPRPLSVPRVTPTIPPPPETTPALAEGIPSFGLPNFGPAAGAPPPPPKRTDGPSEFTLEGLASDDHDYVGSLLGVGPSPAAPPPAAGAPPPAVQVNQIVPAVPMVAPPVLPPVVAPVSAPSPPPADDVLATPPQSGPGTPLVVPADAAAPELSELSDLSRHAELPNPGPMRPLTDSQVEEGRMSFTPFTEQSRRLNIILMVSIGFLLLLTVIVLIAAK